jgi:hypothetical protein
MEKLGSHGVNFQDILYLGIFRKSLENKNKVSALWKNHRIMDMSYTQDEYMSHGTERAQTGYRYVSGKLHPRHVLSSSNFRRQVPLRNQRRQRS